MKAKKFLKLFRSLFLLVTVLGIGLSSCKEDPVEVEDPVASFQYVISEVNDLEVTFTNYSEYAETYSWDFGDGESSAEESPVHEYAGYGDYTVVLTAINSEGVEHDYSATFSLVDPNAALVALHGGSSKTWKLYRDGPAMGVGPDAASARSWWALENDGGRPCVYEQTWTFNNDLTMDFDDAGEMWGDDVAFDGTDVKEICFEATAANMVNKDGVDVSAWLSGTHNYTYDPATGELSLQGTGAWMGLVKLSPEGDVIVPQTSISFNASIEEHDGYDLMIVSLAGDGWYWDFTYASYDNWADEPEVVQPDPGDGPVDLADITPSSLGVTFASRDAADLNGLDTIGSGSSVAFGVDDPADASAAKVGEFTRTAGVDYQELKFKTIPKSNPNDILFDNMSTISIDLYVPSATDFADGGLAKHMVIGFADESEDKGNWWQNPSQFIVEGDDLVIGAWNTYTFDVTEEMKGRTDLDMMFLGLGGGGHGAGGTFYVRNIVVE